MNDLNALKEILLGGGYSCVLSNGKDTVTSKESGIKPLIDFLKSGKDFSGFLAADRIVGRAAAFLYVCMGITSLYACVASVGAAEICKMHGIKLIYDTLTESIINRRGDGICPMEQLVANISTPQEAKDVLFNFQNP